MKKYILFSLLFLFHTTLQAQTFQIDTLLYNGSIDYCINMVLMGDGYTLTQQAQFHNNATNLTNYLFNSLPWSHYKNYFNVFSIKVISNESGAKHPGNATDCPTTNPVPISDPDNYFGCTFDGYDIHRLLIPGSMSAVVNVLNANFPSYDYAAIITNSPYYGGSGGTFATFSADPNSNEIFCHEMGHSFADLADEYYAGDNYFGEAPNQTQQTDPGLVKWSNWMGTNDIGIYQFCCGGETALWYRPHNNCKMRYLNSPFCSVCTQAIIEKIHQLTSPIVSYTPNNLNFTSMDTVLHFKLTKLLKPIPNTLNIKWNLDGNEIASNIDSLLIYQDFLSTGTHSLSVTIVDTSELLRVNNHQNLHFQNVTWHINKTTTGVQLSNSKNKVEVSLFPNPSYDLLNVALQSDQTMNGVIINLFSSNGTLIQSLTRNVFINERNTDPIDISHLTPGTYLIEINSTQFKQTIPFIKH